MAEASTWHKARARAAVEARCKAIRIRLLVITLGRASALVLVLALALTGRCFFQVPKLLQRAALAPIQSLSQSLTLT